MKWRIAWSLVLALVAAPAFALGLGQIQVRSQYGEPFLAEIPIVSGDPSELRQLRARLAPPETFARIGLQPPAGLVLDLQFNVALDAAGRPVIRVTSTAPVEQPLLTFLVEADWGQGRLVREYSALVDAPGAVAAPAQPPIQAPVADAGDRIVRPPARESAGPAPEASAGAAGQDTEPQPAAPPEAQPVPASATPGPARAPAAPERRPAGEYGPVQAGETLGRIVQELVSDGGVSANQMMLALLRTNPGAFIDGNINLLREGAILRIPEPAEAQRLSVAEANAEVRAQVARWREMSAPRAQATAASAAGGEAAADGGQRAAPAADAGARLEIAPPGAADGGQAGIRSGITAGGEGEMLRQELQETRETLAARDAEVEELKARLAELERIQSQQQQLIALKDSELAAVQHRLADSGQASAGMAPAAAAGGLPWLWIGLGIAVLIAAALAWTRARGDRPAAAGRRPAPAWHAFDREDGQPGADQRAAASADPGPDPAPEPPPAAVDAAQAGGEAASPGHRSGLGERLELAKAYVELGDVDTARSLLQEVADAGPGAESDEAARLLRELA